MFWSQYLSFCILSLVRIFFNQMFTITFSVWLDLGCLGKPNQKDLDGKPIFRTMKIHQMCYVKGAICNKCTVLNHKTTGMCHQRWRNMQNRNTGLSDSRAPARVLESLCDERSFTCGEWWLVALTSESLMKHNEQFDRQMTAWSLFNTDHCTRCAEHIISGVFPFNSEQFFLCLFCLDMYRFSLMFPKLYAVDAACSSGVSQEYYIHFSALLLE